jgi:cyanate permease
LALLLACNPVMTNQSLILRHSHEWGEPMRFWMPLCAQALLLYCPLFCRRVWQQQYAAQSAPMCW